MMNRINEIVKNKLACIDIENKHSKGETKITKLNHELEGMRQTLYTMNIDLKISINPYYWEDRKPSTYVLKIEEVA